MARSAAAQVRLCSHLLRPPTYRTATFLPQEQSVSKCIRFGQPKFDSKGRNGYIGTTGIIVVSVDEELLLEPITTRGVNSKACRITLPKSAIRTLIEALEAFAPGPRNGLPRTSLGNRPATA
jgi:hypothetical protein